MSPRGPSGAAALAFFIVACNAEHASERAGVVFVVPEAILADVPDKADTARAFGERTAPLVLRGSSRGKPFGYIAAFARPAGSMQVGLVVSEEGDDGPRVVYADELDALPVMRHAVGVVRPPPGASWPRACRNYLLRFSSPAGELAIGRVRVPGCAKAIEDLRGRALFHIGKGGPPLYSFEGSLRDYKAKIGARHLLRAPLGRAPFFLGWKAAFRGSAKVAVVRVRLAESASGRVAAEDDLPLDPTWDSLAGGYEIPAAPAFPKAGLSYDLTVYVPRADAKSAPQSLGPPVPASDVLARAGVVVGEELNSP